MFFVVSYCQDEIQGVTLKRFFAVFILFVGLICWAISATLPADAAKKAVKAKGAMNAKQIEAINTTVVNLTKKTYTRELYSPRDSEDLISVKLQLDGQMDLAPETALAPIYFRLGSLFKLRGMQTESIDCFQTIIENFSETAYGPKARTELKAMGIEIKENILPTDEDFQARKLALFKLLNATCSHF